MPYITPENRTKYISSIEKVISTFKKVEGEGEYLLTARAELFGFFVDRLIHKFIQKEPYQKLLSERRLNQVVLHDDLNSIVNDISEYYTFALADAGELNYVISAVYWGLLGEAEGMPPVGYGMRVYLRSMLEEIKSKVSVPLSWLASNEEEIFKLRSILIASGVLNDVISEAYRRKTVLYEDLKIVENGDVWKDGKLV